MKKIIDAVIAWFASRPIAICIVRALFGLLLCICACCAFDAKQEFDTVIGVITLLTGTGWLFYAICNFNQNTKIK